MEESKVYPRQLLGGRTGTEGLHYDARRAVFSRLSVPEHDNATRTLIVNQYWGGSSDKVVYAVGLKIQKKAQQLARAYEISVSEERSFALLPPGDLASTLGSTFRPMTPSLRQDRPVAFPNPVPFERSAVSVAGYQELAFPVNNLGPSTPLLGAQPEPSRIPLTFNWAYPSLDRSQAIAGANDILYNQTR